MTDTITPKHSPLIDFIKSMMSEKNCAKAFFILAAINVALALYSFFVGSQGDGWYSLADAIDCICFAVLLIRIDGLLKIVNGYRS